MTHSDLTLLRDALERLSKVSDRLSHPATSKLEFAARLIGDTLDRWHEVDRKVIITWIGHAEQCIAEASEELHKDV